MILTLADVPVDADDRRFVGDFLDKYQDLQWVRDYMPRAEKLDWRLPYQHTMANVPGPPEIAHQPHPPFLGGFDAPNWPSMPPLRPNQLYYPTGASRWAVGVFLMGDAKAANLIANLGGGTLAELVARDNALGYQMVTNVHVLQGRPVGGVLGSKLWAVLVVDERYFAQRDRGQFLYAGAPVEWRDLLQVNGVTCSVVDPAYLRVDHGVMASLNRAGWKMHALDALAACVGRRIVRKHDGTLVAETPAEADVVLTANVNVPRPLAAGGPHGQGATYPQTVRVRFPRPIAAGGPYEKVVARPAGLRAFGEMVIDDSAWAGGDTTIDNQAELDALAERIAADAFEWTRGGYDLTSPIMIPWTPNGFDDFVLYDFATEHWRDKIEANAEAIVSDDGLPHTKIRTSFDRVMAVRAVSLKPTTYVSQMAHRAQNVSNGEAPHQYKADWLHFRLQGTLTKDDATAQADIDLFLDGEKPFPVELEIANFPLANGTEYMFTSDSGGVGLARYDRANDRYWMIQVECPTEPQT